MTVLVTKNGRTRAVNQKGWPVAGIAHPPRQVRSAIDLIGTDAAVSYARMYREQPWVWTVVNKLARGMARLPLKPYRTKDDGSRERERGTPLDRLLSQPFPRGSRFRLVESIVGNLAIYGNALVVKAGARGGARPNELWPLPWQHIEIVPGKHREIDGYIYNGALGRRKFSYTDVVHFEWWSPEGIGISPLEPLRRTLMLEDAGQRYAISSFGNGARPSGAMVTPNRIKNKDHKDELREEVRALHEGPDNAFRIALLDGGLTWQPFAHTAQEAETIAHRKLNREEVAAAYDMPPPVIGILDRATFSNVSEQHRMLYMDTFGPWTTNIEETFQAQMIEEDFSGSFLEFEMGEVMKGNIKERSESYHRFIQSGAFTPNDIRRMENLPRLDNPAADSIYVPANLGRIGDGEDGIEPVASEQQPEPEEDPFAEDEEQEREEEERE